MSSDSTPDLKTPGGPQDTDKSESSLTRSDLKHSNSTMSDEIKEAMNAQFKKPLGAFNAFVGCAVVTNVIIMGMEIDLDLGLVGIIFQHFFVILWTIEMVIKIYLMGRRKYFQCNYNRLDFGLAWLSILDVWILPFVGSGHDSLRKVHALRILRMVRILKAVKVVHAFPELLLLVNGLIKALRTLSWVFVLLGIIVYVGGLFMATVVGAECGQEGVYADFADCDDMFGTMPGSMYTLFQVLTLESWSMAVARPVMKEKPWLVIFFVVFLFLTCFGLMNIVMGVIVEQVLASSAENEEKIIKEKEAQQQKDLSILEKIFEDADENGDMTISTDEFLTICGRKKVQRVFEDFEIPVSRKRLAHRLFCVLDGECKGTIAIQEFVDGMMRLKKEGKGLARDPTLLLMDVRYLGRRFQNLEDKLDQFMQTFQNHISGQQGPIPAGSEVQANPCARLSADESPPTDASNLQLNVGSPREVSTGIVLPKELSAKEKFAASSVQVKVSEPENSDGVSVADLHALKTWLDDRLGGIVCSIESNQQQRNASPQNPPCLMPCYTSS